MLTFFRYLLSLIFFLLFTDFLSCAQSAAIKSCGWSFLWQILYFLNTSYLADSYIVFTLKMESVSKNTIFGIKMMMKSGLEKIFLKFLHAGDYLPSLHKSAQNHKFSNKNNHLSEWRGFEINLSRPLFTIIFRPKIDTDSILRVKTIYASVK